MSSCAVDTADGMAPVDEASDMADDNTDAGRLGGTTVVAEGKTGDDEFGLDTTLLEPKDVTLGTSVVIARDVCSTGFVREVGKRILVLPTCAGSPIDVSTTLGSVTVCPTPPPGSAGFGSSLGCSMPPILPAACLALNIPHIASPGSNPQKRGQYQW